MSVNIRIINAVKRYGDVTVIPDLSLDIKQGEFFTLLGPSGCGKTTLLRMIAGFNSIEGGDFFFNDQRINDLDAAKRQIGMVFQNYAIFPHLSVRKNVEFGLRNLKFPKSEIKERTDKFLALMKIEEFADRMPDRLSGGQQQRVALARALCIEPQVLLMDEPLSNLDAKLRVEMRSAIKEIQHDVGITTVYVTHDQEEAMAVSDRIAVMNHGIIEQIGRPQDLYHRPETLFVSTFIGRSNVVDGVIEEQNGRPMLIIAGQATPFDSIPQRFRGGQTKVIASIRPEEFLINPTDGSGIDATVIESVFLGLNTHYIVELADGQHVEVISESSIDSVLPRGEQLKLGVNYAKANLFLDEKTNIFTATSLAAPSGECCSASAGSLDES